MQTKRNYNNNNKILLIKWYTFTDVMNYKLFRNRNTFENKNPKLKEEEEKNRI